MSTSPIRLALTGLLGASAIVASAASIAATCQAASGARVPAIVELYTSEGCSSCPPAERWVSMLKDRPDVVTLAFHVDYWDNLGWKDRFAQPQFTQRQNASRLTSGARFSYTPQVIVDGQDTPQWSTLGPTQLAAKSTGTIGLTLAQDAGALQLTVTPAVGGATRTGGYVAVVDDGLKSRIAAGENRGATLHEDAVVRELLPWSASGAQTLRLTPTSALEPGAARHWVAVATDEAGRPVQAVTLACAR